MVAQKLLHPATLLVKNILLLGVLLMGTVCAVSQERVALSAERIAGHAENIEQRIQRKQVLRVAAMGAAGLFVASRVYSFFAGSSSRASVLDPSSAMLAGLSLQELGVLKSLATNPALLKLVAPLSWGAWIADWAGSVGSLIARQGALSVSMLVLNDCYNSTKRFLVVAKSARNFAEEETALMQFLREFARVVEKDAENLRAADRHAAATLVFSELEKILGYCDVTIKRRDPKAPLADRLVFYRAELAAAGEALAQNFAQATLADIFAFQREVETILATFSAIEGIA